MASTSPTAAAAGQKTCTAIGAGRLRWLERKSRQPAAGCALQTPNLTKASNAGFGAIDQANGRPFQVQPRPLRVRHTDTGPIAATTRPPAPISHQRVRGT